MRGRFSSDVAVTAAAVPVAAFGVLSAAAAAGDFDFTAAVFDFNCFDLRHRGPETTNRERTVSRSLSYFSGVHIKISAAGDTAIAV